MTSAISRNSIAIAIIIAITLVFNGVLRKRHASTVYGMWYAFCLVLVSSSVISYFAITTKAIPLQGEIESDAGHFVIWLMNAIIDLDHAIIFTFVGLGLVVIPQALAYAISGCFGCAAKTEFVKFSLEVAFWFVVKSLLSASAVVFVVAFTFWINKVKDFTVEDFCDFIVVACYCMLASFGILLPYFKMKSVEAWNAAARFPTLLDMLSKIHAKATCHREALQEVTVPDERIPLREARQCWEHEVVSDLQGEDIKVMLNRMGSNGWQLVTAIPSPLAGNADTYAWYFKRELNSGSEQPTQDQVLTSIAKLSHRLKTH